MRRSPWAGEQARCGVPARRAGGFTLLELLTASAVLVIIVLMSLRIFVQSSTIWNSGKKRADVNMMGRAVADFLAQTYAATNHPENLVDSPHEYTLADFGVKDGAGPTVATATRADGSNVVVTVTVGVSTTDPLRGRSMILARSAGPDGVFDSPDDVNSSD